MEVLEVQRKILDLIQKLDIALGELRKRGEERAYSIAVYESKIAKVLIQLKNGVEFDMDGQKIQDPPNTIIEKLAKGLCSSEKVDMELCETRYKNCLEGIKAIQCEITAYQSINKYFDKI